MSDILAVVFKSVVLAKILYGGALLIHQINNDLKHLHFFVGVFDFTYTGNAIQP